MNVSSIFTGYLQHRVSHKARFSRLGQLLVSMTLLLMSSMASALPAGFSEENVLTGLTEPVHLATLPNGDGRMFVLESFGHVKIFNPSDVVPTATTILSINNVANINERGAVSITLDPNFASNGFFYIYYTHTAVWPEVYSNALMRNRISRFTFDGTTSSAATEVMVWEDNTPTFFQSYHFGGGLDFGPDGMLYLSTGEEFNGAQAQDLTQAGGKIIRLNTANLDSGGPWVRGGANTHIIPADNPNLGAGALPELWAKGLRNPFRMHWDLEGAGRMYIGEVGGNTITATEDLHIGAVGADYGWPDCQGVTCIPAHPGASPPIYEYGHVTAINGGAIAAGVTSRASTAGVPASGFPASFEGAFFHADYVFGTVSYLLFNPDGSFASDNAFTTGAGNPVGFEFGPDGALYVVDIAGQVAGAGRVIKYVSNSGKPIINTATASPTSGVAPLSVNFTAAATNPGSGSLTYLWDFGDGTTSSTQNPTHIYPEGSYSALLQVTNTAGTTISSPIEIQAGAAPIVTITSPLEGSLFKANDTINYAASVTNPTGSTYTYAWTIVFTHNVHTHPSISYTGQSNSFVVDDQGHDFLGDTGFNLSVKVTEDATGLNTTVDVDIVPDKIDMTLATVPAGLSVFIDGLPQPTPSVYDTIIEFNHLISAQEFVCDNDTQYQFSSWSVGGERSQSIIIPASDFTLTANYVNIGACTANIPLANLAAHYEADQGVSASGTTVTGWSDLSANGNDLNVVAGDPQLVPNMTNGQPAIDFDGAGDKLERISNLTGFPSGNSDRTVYLVANYSGGGFYGGAAFGNGAAAEAFGLVVSPPGDLTIQGYAADEISGTLGRGAGWLVQSAVVESNNLKHYLNGNIIDDTARTYSTVLNKLVLGAEITDSNEMDMEIAALIIYDRALDASEQNQVQQYLQNKYISPVGNQAPVAVADNAVVNENASVTFSITNNDTDDGTIDVATVVITTMPGNGTVVDNNDGTVTYMHSGPGTIDSFQYTVDDDLGLTSNVATVSITTSGGGGAIPQGGLVAFYEADAGVVLNGGTVASWNDQSTQGNTLTGSGGPTVLPTGLGGKPVISFDGIDDILQRTSGVTGLSSGDEDRTIYMVVNYDGVGYGGLTYGNVAANQAFGMGVADTGNLAIFGWGGSADKVSGTAGTAAGWMIHSVDVVGNTMRHYVNGVEIDSRAGHAYNTVVNKLVVGAELRGTPIAPFVDMQVAAIAIYDKGLNTSDKNQIESYLQSKYFASLFAADDGATSPVRGVASIPVLANDLGSLDSSTVTIVNGATNGRALANANGTVTYIHNGTGSSDTFTYTVDDLSGNTSNPATVTITFNPPGNMAPVAANDTASTSNSGSVIIPVLANDSDNDGNLVPSGVSVVVSPPNGTAIANTDGTITYTHNGSATTSDSFQYRVNDNDAATSNAATVNLSIAGGAAPPANAPPVAVSDSATVQAAGTITLGLGAPPGPVVVDLTANDIDSDGSIDDSTLLITSPPSNGTVIYNGDGTVSYTHNGNGTSDSFQYTVRDDAGATSNVATVTVQVTTPDNQSPVATADSATVTSGGTITINLTGNDTDVDGSVAGATVLITSLPANGTVVNNNNGTVTYTHVGPANSDAFQYSVDDNAGATSNIATVSVTATGGTTTGAGRVTANLEAYYTFSAGSGTTVFDQSGVTPAINLSIQDGSAVTWGSGTLSVNSVTSIQSSGAASRLNSAISSTNEITMEGWVRASNLSQSGPARIVSLSNSAYARNMTLGQVGNRVDMRLRTTTTGNNGSSPSLMTPSGSLNTSLVHIVYTRAADGTARLYLNGAQSATAQIGGNLSNWDNGSALILANEFVHTRAWLGEYDLVAIYSRALTPAEVSQNYAAGSSVSTRSDMPVENRAPSAEPDSAFVVSGGSVTVNVAANDTDTDGSVVASSTLLTESANNGTVRNNGDGTVTYTHSGGGSSDTFKYTINDDDGETSNATTVTITINDAENGEGAENGPGAGGTGERVSVGLEAYYTFSAGNGPTVYDQSGVNPALDLTIQNVNAVSWGDGTLNVNSATSIETTGAASRLTSVLSAANAVTVEAWVTSADVNQSGPARIVSLSGSAYSRNLTLGQAGDRIEMRLRTNTTGDNGSRPSVLSPLGSIGTARAHIVYTRANDGTARIYLNNVEVSSAQIDGDMSAWDSSFGLILANEYVNKRPWRGEYDTVAIYSRALSSAEVDQNYTAGP